MYIVFSSWKCKRRFKNMNIDTYTPAYTCACTRAFICTQPRATTPRCLSPLILRTDCYAKTHNIESKLRYSPKDFYIGQNIFSPITIFITPICEQGHDIDWLYKICGGFCFCLVFLICTWNLKYTSLKKKGANIFEEGEGCSFSGHLICLKYRGRHFAYIISINPWTTCWSGWWYVFIFLVTTFVWDFSNWLKVTHHLGYNRKVLFIECYRSDFL